jgi:threonyl-tRNA synthetase
VGMREAEEGKVALRRFGSQGQEIMTLEDALQTLAQEGTPPDMKA